MPDNTGLTAMIGEFVEVCSFPQYYDYIDYDFAIFPPRYSQPGNICILSLPP